MVLVCLNQTSATQAAVREAGCFAVNILGADQGDIAFRFATKSGSEKFEGARRPGRRDVPLIAARSRTSSAASPRWSSAAPTPSSSPRSTTPTPARAPLLHLLPREVRAASSTELEEAAYRELRRLVLTREMASGAALSHRRRARAAPQSRAPAIFYVLTKLSMDWLAAALRRRDTASPRSRCSPPTRPPSSRSPPSLGDADLDRAAGVP